MKMFILYFGLMISTLVCAHQSTVESCTVVYDEAYQFATSMNFVSTNDPLVNRTLDIIRQDWLLNTDRDIDTFANDWYNTCMEMNHD